VVVGDVVLAVVVGEDAAVPVLAVPQRQCVVTGYRRRLPDQEGPATLHSPPPLPPSPSQHRTMMLIHPHTRRGRRPTAGAPHLPSISPGNTTLDPWCGLRTSSKVASSSSLATYQGHDQRCLAHTVQYCWRLGQPRSTQGAPQAVVNQVVHLNARKVEPVAAFCREQRAAIVHWLAADGALDGWPFEAVAQLTCVS
jgi:hypothetical protein